MYAVGSRGASVPKIKRKQATKEGGDNACGWEFAKVKGQRERKWVEKWNVAKRDAVHMVGGCTVPRSEEK